MRTSAAGNRVTSHRLAPPGSGPAGNAGVARRQPWSSNGFTLLELLLVMAIVAVASAGVTLALRDSAQARLETEAQRLAAVLESARAQSRASGVPVRWRTTATGFALDGLPGNPVQAWGSAGITAHSEQPVLLGPEPLIPPQTVRLWLTEQPQHSVLVATDGVRPFAVHSAEPGPTP